MKNLFQMTYDKSSHSTHAEFEKYVIAKLSKNEEQKLDSMSQKYNNTQQKQYMPKGLYLVMKISFMAFFFFAAFLLLFVLLNIGKDYSTFFKNNLIMIIVVLVSLVVFLISILIASILKKKKKKQNINQKAEILFNEILEESKKFLKVPSSAVSLEILMNYSTEKKGKVRDFNTFNNVVLNVYIEKDNLCMADLYSVIGIPLKSLQNLEEVKKPYTFKYWHQNTEYNKNDVKYLKRLHCFQANSYYVLFLKKQEVGIYLPAYEIEKWKEILNIK